jgi:hypothetical protein
MWPRAPIAVQLQLTKKPISQNIMIFRALIGSHRLDGLLELGLVTSCAGLN